MENITYLLCCICAQMNETDRGTRCNRAIMIITDGAPRNFDEIFRKYNWPEKHVRLTHHIMQHNYLTSYCKISLFGTVIIQHLSGPFHLVTTLLQVRVFTYLIGREVGDPKQVIWMACANKGN